MNRALQSLHGDLKLRLQCLLCFILICHFYERNANNYMSNNYIYKMKNKKGPYTGIEKRKTE